MECPFCGAELFYDTYFFIGASRDPIGDIYECPNSDGFRSLDEALTYLETIGETFDSLGIKKENFDSLECLNDYGDRFYYTYRDNDDELHAGYPC